MFRILLIALLVFTACKPDRPKAGVYATCIITRGNAAEEKDGDHDHGANEVAIPLNESGSCPMGAKIRFSSTMPGKGTVAMRAFFAGKEFTSIAHRGEDMPMAGELELRGIVPGKHELKIVFEEIVVKVIVVEVK